VVNSISYGDVGALFVQGRAGRFNVTVQRSLSSPRATVASSNDMTPSLVHRHSSLRETSSSRRSAAANQRQTSSASSSPLRRRSGDVTAGCLATAQVPAMTSSAAGGSGNASGRGGRCGRAAGSMLPTATTTHRRTGRPADNASPTNVQQRLQVNTRQS